MKDYFHKIVVENENLSGGRNEHGTQQIQVATDPGIKYGVALRTALESKISWAMTKTVKASVRARSTSAGG